MIVNMRATSKHTLRTDFDRALDRLIAKARQRKWCDDIVECIELERSNELARARTPKERKRAHDRYEHRLLRLATEPITFAYSSSGRREQSYEQNSAWYRLMELRSRAFTKLLVKYLRYSETDVRRKAAKMLAWTALDRDLPALLRAAGGTDADIISHIAQGAASAVEYRHASSRFRARLFDALAPVASGTRRLKNNSVSPEPLSDVPPALAKLDWSRAKSLLTSSACLNPKNPALFGVLRAICDPNTGGKSKKPPKFDAARLWMVYRSIEAGKTTLTKNFKELAQGLALIILARADPIAAKAEAKAILKRRLPSGSALARDARQAQRICARVTEPNEAYLRLIKDPKAFPTSAAEVLQAYELYQHTSRDGLRAYFDNMGECVAQAQRGLERLGLNGAAKLIAAPARMFWKARQPRASSRDAAGDNISEADAAKIESFGDKITETNAIELAVERYMLAHPGDFLRAMT